jgi:pimeloyl-ACP methyl ester carboxylesterase
MAQKVAVAVVHGIGKQDADFGNPFMERILTACEGECAGQIAIRPVHWADALQDKENDLVQRLRRADEPLDWMPARQLMIDFVADALAYQITKSDRNVYDAVHARFASALARLAKDAGGDAPLIIVAHSLGTVIASNYIYDLQHPHLIESPVRSLMTDTPLERGETLTRLFTLGSPLALWSLRYNDFGRPIRLPSPPAAYAARHPEMSSQWLNIYDRDDVIGFPLKTLNAAYGEAVHDDLEINVGNLASRETPLSHTGYDTSKRVIRLIADGIVDSWKAVNGG